MMLCLLKVREKYGKILMYELRIINSISYDFFDCGSVRSVTLRSDIRIFIIAARKTFSVMRAIVMGGTVNDNQK